MNEKEMINNLIDTYTNLQRIETSNNPKEEAQFQIRIVKAKLESFGIITTDLELNKNI